jgi:Nuclear transport factor 2 (NTF2) domain
MNIISYSSQIFTDINNIDEPVIDRYFSSLNAHNFEEVAQLFSLQGCLYPPFERGICGREAIYQYLQAEGGGIEAFPQSVTIQSHPAEQTFIYQIVGYVKTSFFTVNVSWSMQLNSTREILSVEVKLLASLEDLLKLKHKPRQIELS